MVLYIFPDSFYASPLQISPEKSQKKHPTIICYAQPKKANLIGRQPGKKQKPNPETVLISGLSGPPKTLPRKQV